jgi:choline dehydrogenase-like flavoprotein
LSPGNQHPGYQSLQWIVKSLRQGRAPGALIRHLGNVLAGLHTVAPVVYRRLLRSRARRFTIGIRAEQLPNPHNRVTLDTRRDALGMPRVRLEWKLGGQDLDGLRRALRILFHEVDPRVAEVVAFDAGADRWVESIKGGAHHIGTTRMHRHPGSGVVDEHCRVHGTSNLFIAGSSVFPTAGWAPPTLTIVALALRLADHLKQRYLE